MVTEKNLFSNRYKFKDVSLEVIEKDEKDNVMIFSATTVTTKLPGQFMSNGMMELNRGLLNQDSTKRPPGYWSMGSREEDGILTCIFVSEEWYENTSKEIRNQKINEWGVK